MQIAILITILLQIMFTTSDAASRLGEWKEVEESIHERKPNSSPPCRPGVRSNSISITHECKPNSSPQCRPGLRSHSIALVHVPTAVIRTVHEGTSGKPAFDYEGKKPIFNQEEKQKTAKKS